MTMTTSSSLGSASASMHPTVSPTSSNDSDFSVASLADGLPPAKSGSGNERDEGYNEDPVSRALWVFRARGSRPCARRGVHLLLTCCPSCRPPLNLSETSPAAGILVCAHTPVC